MKEASFMTIFETASIIYIMLSFAMLHFPKALVEEQLACLS